MTPERWSLAGKRAVVTGGTKGIGAAVAAELTALGAEVVIVARSVLGADDIAADISTEAGRRAVVDRIGDTPLDILVNNVGTNIRKASLEYSADEFEHVFRTNLTSAWEMSRALHPSLKRSASGSIVNIGSVAGQTSVHSGAPYAMTKAALDQLTRYLAVEWAPDGIRVNGVSPWYTKTPLANAVLDRPEFTAAVLERTPNRRIADPEDVSGLVAFLCLPVSSHITGQVIAVDGGFLAFGF